MMEVYAHMDWIIWFVVLLPFLGFAINASIGPRINKHIVSVIGCGVILVPFLISICAFFKVLIEGAFSSIKFVWISIPGQVDIPLQFYIDHLTALMLLVVSGVSFIIHIYSIGYMWQDRRYARYFAFLNLFVGFMLLLVSAKNLLLMFIGWEGVGLCSYLLIGFWFEDREKAAAGTKAFIVNRVGDFAFMIGVITLFVSVGAVTGEWTLDIQQISEEVGKLRPDIITLICLLLFWGACGKSAQIPLYVWLPDAMAGPTPVSALIHAATMVTAGVYMVARLSFLFSLSPVALTVVATIGALTAIFAATIGFCQTDFKRILAYSTISQLGYMFLGVGVGAYYAGIFHLMTHAFFKACLFLCSGSVIHATEQQDIRYMGALRKFMPVTYVTFLIATLAIAGVPPFAGFFSKDEILWYTFTTDKLITPWWGNMLWVIGIIGAGFTAFYMFRLMWIAFGGKEYRGAIAHASGGGVVEHHHKKHLPHESPPVMTIPLIVLAILSVIGGFVGIPEAVGHIAGIEDYQSPIEKFLHPSFEHNHHKADIEKPVSPEKIGLELTLMGVSILVAISGISVAAFMYVFAPGAPAYLAAKLRGLYHLVYNKYFVDEVYQSLIVKPLIKFDSLLARYFDYGVIDATVDGTGVVTSLTSQNTGNFDNLVIDGAVNATASSARGAGSDLRQIQTGNLRSYISSTAAGILILIFALCVFVLSPDIISLVRDIFR